MGYIPAPIPRQPASARAQDLGRRLKAEIDKFESQYPGTSRSDIRRAAGLAIGEEEVATPPRRRVAALISGALVAAAILGSAVPMLQDGLAKGLPLWPIGGLVFVIGIAAGFSIKRLRDRK